MADDPYCYPGTNVLINKEDIRAADDLEQFERLATAQRLREGLPSVPLTVDGYCEVVPACGRSPWTKPMRAVSALS
jgi:hypothetical protein